MSIISDIVPSIFYAATKPPELLIPSDEATLAELFIFCIKHTAQWRRDADDY